MPSSGGLYAKVSEDVEEPDLDEYPGEQPALLQRVRWTKIFLCLRVPLDIALLVCVLALVFRHGQTTGDRTSNLTTMPSFATRDILFKSEPAFVNAETFANQSSLQDTLRFWTRMSTGGRGVIIVATADRNGLPQPYVVPLPERERIRLGKEKEEVYMVSMFHQLHCLSTLMRSYGLMVIEGSPPADIDHDAHCFDFIRQALLCASDLTVEGSSEYGEGWGAIHKCKDVDAIKSWAESQAGFSGHQFGQFL
ncbi:hypothetical protein BJ170DRAFT_617386 [Xylariales sp. AK1849]|nr:hypothetical protein BJ170DRAFT_617386 [Xylariales sp. AK1849]